MTGSKNNTKKPSHARQYNRRQINEATKHYVACVIMISSPRSTQPSILPE